MKGIKVLLAGILVLLGVVIVVQIQIMKKSSPINPPVPPDPHPHVDTIAGNPLPHNEPTGGGTDVTDSFDTTTTSYVEVKCLACAGLGHNSYELNGNTCTVCGGKKIMEEKEMLKRYKEWSKKRISCNMCGGTGLSYEARVTNPMDRDLMAPPGYYDCKVCNGKKEGTRAELIKNFKVASQVYGPAL